MPEHILSLSYGKDSTACLGAIEHLGWPLDRIVHAEVWATDAIQADLPPMVEFKAKADGIIKKRWGIEVEHFRHNLSYEEIFYRPICRGPKKGTTKGWPLTSKSRAWCKNLKVVNKLSPDESISYIGIAADEPDRFHNLTDTKKSPLVELGWTEADCRRWCEENDLLSPIYTTATRGGCWFCHNQGVEQLRLLRKNYPELWALMLKWDADSPVTFKPGYRDRNGVYHEGKTVHDYDERFQLEDMGLIQPDEKFLWSMIEDGGVNYRLF